MKIIEVPNQQWSARLTCADDRCATVVEVEPTDLKGSYATRGGKRLYVNCPTCHKAIWLDDAGVPPVPRWVENQATVPSCGLYDR